MDLELFDYADGLYEDTKEQKITREMLRDFAEREIAPEIQLSDDSASYNRSFLLKMGRLGILGLCISERYGGSGFDYNCLAIACEELEKVDNSARLTLTTHVATYIMPLVQWGTDEQKVKYLIPAVKGQNVGAFALSESEAGSDAWNIKVTAHKEGDHYVLNGTKDWVSLIDVADNFLVFARIGKKLSCFIVERSFPGVETQSISGKMYIRVANTGQLLLNNVRIPRENVLGEIGEGTAVASSAMDNARFTVAAGAVGLIQGCLNSCIKYAQERKAFGQPIGNFQLVQSKIVDISTSAITARYLVHNVGWLMNKGQFYTREAAMAKCYATKQAFEAASHAIQIHGAYAYLHDLPLERYLRNAKGAMIYTGTNEIMEIIIAEYALGIRKDKPFRKLLPSWPFEDNLL